MDGQKKEFIKNYFQRIKEANKELTKKEHFKALLHKLYHGEKEIEQIIDSISAGAETTIVNIPRRDRFHKGSADTLYNKVIIEFENDLKKSYQHAKLQLAGYLLGQFNSGEGYNYTLIVSDFINWKVVIPDISCLDKLESLTEDKLILNDVPDSSFTLNENNVEDFYYWIDRFLFKEEKQKATLKRIEVAFGYKSNIFIECYRQILGVFNEAKKFGEVQVSYEQWKKFLSIAYGSYNDSESSFVIHTYLSVFAKILAYEVVSNDDYIDDKEMRGILDGSIFHRYNIQNFVDNDFFHWVKSDMNYLKLGKVYRLIAQEIANFDFHEVDEDVLKGVYQELIDLDTRHSLGEYYTPDWLCERIVQEFDFKPDDKILDPSCGSGSFLRAAIHRLRQLNQEISVEQVNNAVNGIDIHPLSVQIAKTTILVALGKDVVKAKNPIHINIILANTLLAPDGVKDLFTEGFIMQIDREKYKLNTSIFDDVNLFDQAIQICDDLAEQTKGQKIEKLEIFEKILKQKYKVDTIDSKISDSFYKIYGGLKKVKESGRDSIWKFIVQNLYKPYFLRHKFDYIIGNPPWFTYSSIKNEEYQDLLSKLATKYDVKPEKVANFPHLEIAAIFLAYCTNYFLKPRGKLAFVLPRSFFSADHHNNTRSGKVKGLRLTEIWDLNDVSPLFRIPSAVLFSEQSGHSNNIPETGLAGKIIGGNLPAHNCNLSRAKAKITEREVLWYYIKQGKSSALSIRNTKANAAINPYKKKFKQGATLVPRTFYFIELDQEMPPDFEHRIINVKTAEAVKPDAKAPWKEIEFNKRIESQFLFRTALSKSILPFALFKPDLVLLPITISLNNRNKKYIELKTPQDLIRAGYLMVAKWMQDCENVWDQLKTEKNQNISSADYLNWNNKILDQDLNAPYLVLYNASAKDANATVVKREDLDLEFIAEHKGYALYTSILNEAYYLTAILNSSVPNLLIKDFQSKGLFGARDVHKKILDVYYPLFNPNDALHVQLAEYSKAAHEKTAKYIASNPPQEPLTALRLGRLRTEIKKHVAQELSEIDKLVKELIA